MSKVIIGYDCGQCPYCNSEDLKYGAYEVLDNYYPVTCNNCGRSFEEHYSKEFLANYSDGTVFSVLSSKQ